MTFSRVSRLFLLTLVFGIFAFGLQAKLPEKYKTNVVTYAIAVLDELETKNEQITDAETFRTQFATALKGKTGSIPKFEELSPAHKFLYQSTVTCIFDLAAAYVGAKKWDTRLGEATFFEGMEGYVQGQLDKITEEESLLNEVIGENGAGELFRDKIYKDSKLSELGGKFMGWYGFLWKDLDKDNWKPEYAKTATLWGPEAEKLEKGKRVASRFETLVKGLSKKEERFKESKAAISLKRKMIDLKNEATELIEAAKEDTSLNDDSDEIKALKEALKDLKPEDFVEKQEAINKATGPIYQKLVEAYEEQFKKLETEISRLSPEEQEEAIQKIANEIEAFDSKHKDELANFDKTLLETQQTKFQKAEKPLTSAELQELFTAAKEHEQEKEEKIQKAKDDKIGIVNRKTEIEKEKQTAVTAKEEKDKELLALQEKLTKARGKIKSEEEIQKEEEAKKKQEEEGKATKLFQERASLMKGFDENSNNLIGSGTREDALMNKNLVLKTKKDKLLSEQEAIRGLSKTIVSMFETNGTLKPEKSVEGLKEKVEELRTKLIKFKKGFIKYAINKATLYRDLSKAEFKELEPDTFEKIKNQIELVGNLEAALKSEDEDYNEKLNKAQGEANKLLGLLISREPLYQAIEVTGQIQSVMTELAKKHGVSARFAKIKLDEKISKNNEVSSLLVKIVTKKDKINRRSFLGILKGLEQDNASLIESSIPE